MEITFDKLSISTQACRIASHIYAISVLETSTGNWHVYFDKLESYYNIDIRNNQELIEKIEDELYNYEGILDLEIHDDCFDLILGLDYCAGDYIEGQDEIYEEEE